MPLISPLTPVPLSSKGKNFTIYWQMLSNSGSLNQACFNLLRPKKPQYILWTIEEHVYYKISPLRMVKENKQAPVNKPRSLLKQNQRWWYLHKTTALTITRTWNFFFYKKLHTATEIKLNALPAITPVTALNALTRWSTALFSQECLLPHGLVLAEMLSWISPLCSCQCGFSWWFCSSGLRYPKITPS